MSEQNLSPALLGRMYNNFVKITDWVIKGKESQHQMPKALAWLFDTTEQNTNEVAELKQLVTTLQSNLIEKEQRITALDGALQNVNATLANFINVINSQTVTGITPQTKNTAVSEPVAPAPQPTSAPAPVEVTEELVDLDDVASTETPNEQAIQVSAGAVGAGQLDPASYSALDAEINSLLG